MRSQGEVGVAVLDRGHGMSAETLQRMFEPFFTTKVNGLGMGLAISRTIVEAHGGLIWATSDAVNGSVFHVTLPPAEDCSDDA
jgi:signal transduction histidine kinase